jgi:AcrR family transcriptional regulator
MAAASEGKLTGASARDRVFAAAADLFYRKGIHAVGVEEIVREAGVAKISLYRSFASKDDLVVAYPQARGRTFLEGWDDAFSRYREAPKAQLRAIMSYARRAGAPEAGGRLAASVRRCLCAQPDARPRGRSSRSLAPVGG